MPAAAAMSLRLGGRSAGPWASLNLGDHVGDDPAAVQSNRERFAAVIGAAPVYLRQVHGARVVRVTRASLGVEPPEADASVSTERDVACTVLVADCLPVLLAAPHGVAAAHAGWRGLAAGVVEATLEALCREAHCRPADVRAWLGACIGPRAFEVGADVLGAFGPGAAGRFRPRAERPGKWLADLAGLARDRLVAAGVADVSGGTWCTVADPSRFFSFRRDGVTGRLAAAVWLR